jgi:uncharacterized protein
VLNRSDKKMAVKIDVYKHKDLSLHGATIIDGFSSSGMIGSIVANYLVDSLKLDQISVLDSDNFPALSLIYDSKPKYPVQIFADEQKKLVVFLSEFTPGQHLVKPIADTILSWAEENKCRRVITAEALLSREDHSYKEHMAYGVGNVDSARRDLQTLDITQLRTGIITGVSAELLNLGMRLKFDVICLLAEINANDGISAVVAAAKVIEAIAKLLPNVAINTAALYKEAEKFETWTNEQQSPLQMFG